MRKVQSVPTAAAKIERHFLNFLEARLNLMGELESGLYNYYKSYFLEKKTGFASHDLPVASFFNGLDTPFASIVEVGAGIGQLSALLAAIGFEAFALDRENRRAIAAKDFFEKLCAEMPDLIGRLHFYHDKFPSPHLPAPNKQTALVFTNILNSDADEVEPCFFAGISGYGAVLVDLVKFSRARVWPAEWEELTHLIMEKGYGAPTEVFSIGEAGSKDLIGLTRIAYFPAL